MISDRGRIADRRRTRRRAAGSVALLLALALAPAQVPAKTKPAPSQQVWDVEYSAPITLSRNVVYLDLDPDNHSAAQIAALVAGGVTPICYVSVGTVENYRSDKGAFPPSVVGKVYGDWPDEKFLDIRQRDVLIPIMRARFQRCADLGFKAIDPDNVDAYQNDSGFPLTEADTLAYMRALADEAHALGLMIGQKNVPDLTPKLVDGFDFAVVESCHKQGWCGRMLPYAAAGKPVLAIEYKDQNPRFKEACAWGKANGVAFILKKRALNSWVKTCP